jgi:acetyl esterase
VIHPDVAARFPMLDGLTSMREAYGTPVGLERIRAYESWEPEESPPVVEIRDDVAPGPHGPVPVRIYGPPTGERAGRPCLVWAHGGGFVGGNLDMREADWTAREVCARAGAVVVSVDYRLAVDGLCYPVPHDDTVAAVCWVRERAAELGVDADRISIGGASAGANLTAGAVLKLRDRDGWLPRALVFVYGVAHPVVPPPSPALAAALAELPAVLAPPPGQRDDFLTLNYLGGALSSADGYAMPALAQLEGLCPVLVINAECDRLRASAEAFTAALAVAGVDVRQVMVRGLLHGFLNQPADLAPVGECLDLIAATVEGHA